MPYADFVPKYKTNTIWEEVSSGSSSDDTSEDDEVLVTPNKPTPTVTASASIDKDLKACGVPDHEDTLRLVTAERARRDGVETDMRSAQQKRRSLGAKPHKGAKKAGEGDNTAAAQIKRGEDRLPPSPVPESVDEEEGEGEGSGDDAELPVFMWEEELLTFWGVIGEGMMGGCKAVGRGVATAVRVMGRGTLGMIVAMGEADLEEAQMSWGWHHPETIPARSYQ